MSERDCTFLLNVLKCGGDVKNKNKREGGREEWNAKVKVMVTFLK